MLFVSAAEEMKRSAVDLKFPGFQIGSHVGEWNLDAKELDPIYKVGSSLEPCLIKASQLEDFKTAETFIDG